MRVVADSRAWLVQQNCFRLRATLLDAADLTSRPLLLLAQLRTVLQHFQVRLLRLPA